MDNVNILPAGTTPIATDDIAGVHVQRIKLQAGIDGTAVDYLHAAARSDTFTATGAGTGFNVVNQGVGTFAMQVKGTGAVPTSWTVAAQVSLNGTNWVTIMTHTNTEQADGDIVWTGANHYPSLYFRINVTALSLGSATNIVVTILGR